jgi:putative tributyrin esterase
MLVKFNYLSQALRMQTNVTMCLPSFSFSDAMTGKADSYTPGTTFQTLYLLHGGFGDDSDYVNFTNIVRYADEHKVAVVMPNGYNSFYEDRHTDAFGGQFWQFVSEELPRVCQTMFPLSPNREDTFVAGLSMGASGAMKLAIEESDRFSTALLMSGVTMDQSVLGKFTTDEGGADPDHLEAQAADSVRRDMAVYRHAEENAALGRSLPRFILTCGSDDFILPAVRAGRDLLEEFGYPVDYHEVPGYTHEWDFWDLSLRKAFDEWLPLRHDVIPPA